MSDYTVQKRLSEFAFIDQHGDLHIDIPKFLRAHNYPDTEANVEQLTKEVAQFLQQQFPKSKIVTHP